MITLFPDVAKFLSLYSSAELMVSGRLLPLLLDLGTFKKACCAGAGDTCCCWMALPRLPAWELRLCSVLSGWAGKRNFDGGWLFGTKGDKLLIPEQLLGRLDDSSDGISNITSGA